MKFLHALLHREITKKALALLCIGIFFYAIKEMINIFLLTFLLTYLMYSVRNFIYKWASKVIHVSNKMVTIVLYAALVSIMAFVFYRYTPLMVNQIIAIANQVSEFDINSNLSKNKVSEYVAFIIDSINVEGNLKEISNYIIATMTNVGKWSFNILIALILSLFFLLEKTEIQGFVVKFKNSKINWLYKYVNYFGSNFLNSFGKVMQVQISIAFINSTLSVVALWIMGFPQLLGLGIMIFILGLIPVAGVVISLIPLSIIAFKIGGVIKVIYVFAMIIGLHGLESYVVNPKLMSNKTKLPVFVTFGVLIVSEHFMGIWGLLLGMPLFMFILDLLNVNPSEESIFNNVKE